MNDLDIEQQLTDERNETPTVTPATPSADPFASLDDATRAIVASEAYRNRDHPGHDDAVQAVQAALLSAEEGADRNVNRHESSYTPPAEAEALDPGTMRTFVSVAEAEGLARPITDAILRAAAKHRVTGTTSIEACAQALQAAWGDEYEMRLERAVQYAARYPELVRLADSGWGNEPEIIKAIDAAITAEEATDEAIKAATADPLYRDGSGGEAHRAAVEKVRRLYERRYGKH